MGKNFVGWIFVRKSKSLYSLIKKNPEIFLQQNDMIFFYLYFFHSLIRIPFNQLRNQYSAISEHRYSIFDAIYTEIITNLNAKYVKNL